MFIAYSRYDQKLMNTFFNWSLRSHSGPTDTSSRWERHHFCLKFRVFFSHFFQCKCIHIFATWLACQRDTASVTSFASIYLSFVLIWILCAFRFVHQPQLQYLVKLKYGYGDVCSVRFSQGLSSIKVNVIHPANVLFIALQYSEYFNLLQYYSDHKLMELK